MRGNVKCHRLLKSKTPKDNLITGSICSFCGIEGWRLTKRKFNRKTEFSEILFVRSAAERTPQSRKEEVGCQSGIKNQYNNITNRNSGLRYKWHKHFEKVENHIQRTN
jgi:hypothetical protein